MSESMRLKNRFHPKQNVEDPVRVRRVDPPNENMTADDVRRERKSEYNHTAYAKNLGGPSACRITIPLQVFDDVEYAAAIIADLAEGLDELCKSETLRQASKIFHARSLCYQAHTQMKRGQYMYRNLR